MLRWSSRRSGHALRGSWGAGRMKVVGVSCEIPSPRHRRGMGVAGEAPNSRTVARV